MFKARTIWHLKCRNLILKSSSWRSSVPMLLLLDSSCNTQTLMPTRKTTVCVWMDKSVRMTSILQLCIDSQIHICILKSCLHHLNSDINYIALQTITKIGMPKKSGIRNKICQFFDLFNKKACIEIIIIPGSIP